MKIVEKDREFGKILGINVLVTRNDRVIRRVKEFISHNTKFYIVTPNPELVLMAQDNLKLKSALNDADLPVPDGVGLKVAIPNLPIIKGRKLFMNLVEEASKSSWKVFLLGGEGAEAKLTSEKLKLKYPGLKISSEKGPMLDDAANPVTEAGMSLEKDAIQKINRFSPDLLFVAFRNPKQEIWIHDNLSRLKTKGAMAVGGTFRYIAGMSKLPPRWMEETGLEWVWRLITEPYRALRIFKAFLIFPMKVFWYKITHTGN